MVGEVDGAEGRDPVVRDLRLIGRDHEIGVLAAEIGRDRDVGSVMVVLGEPGIGKTSLLRAAQVAARRRGCRVLGSVGVQAEAQLPFAGLHQLLGPLLADVDDLPEIHGRASACCVRTH